VQYSTSRVLVTGGAGFIGSRLVGRLASQGARVTVVDDFSNSQPSAGLNGVTVTQMRLPDPGFPALVANGRFDEVFHLAGASYVPPSVEDPIGDMRNNAEVTLQVLEAVRRGSPATSLVYTSSAAVYGNPSKLPIEETDPLVPVSPYGVSKRSAESYVSLYADMHGLRTASLRLFSVYGPGQRKQVVFDLINRLHENPMELLVFGTGEEVRDFVFVDDVVEAAMGVMACGPLQGEVYNVASGEEVSIDQLARIIAKTLRLTPEIRFTGSVRPGDALKWSADTSRLRALGVHPSVSLRDGIGKVIEWYSQLS